MRQYFGKLFCSAITELEGKPNPEIKIHSYKIAVYIFLLMVSNNWQTIAELRHPKQVWVAFTTADPRGKASAVDYSIKQIQ